MSISVLKQAVGSSYMPVEYTEDYIYNAKNQLVKRSRRNPESPYDKYKHNDKTNNLSANDMSDW